MALINKHRLLIVRKTLSSFGSIIDGQAKCMLFIFKESGCISGITEAWQDELFSDSVGIRFDVATCHFCIVHLQAERRSLEQMLKCDLETTHRALVDVEGLRNIELGNRIAG